MPSTRTGTAQPLLRELIEIPERVHQGDFVLRLTEGVQRRQATLDSYVITPQLRVAFDEALGLIGSALTEHRSKASYLHGSFGSGKSHFMAVLHAVLDGDVSARSRPELADLVARHHWLATTRFLLVPYHLIGAESLEAAILGGYVEHVRQAHPDAPLPALYREQGLINDARAIRDRLGTEAFLAALPSAESDGSWGELDTGWTAAELDEAFAAAPDSALAQRLVSDVVPTFMPNFVASVAGAASAFVPLDQGLATLTRHAKGLGYDGVVLFLDELVLWLAGKIADPAFVGRETEKVAKLVESSDARRAVPIISFIARQRDLRELVGAERTGAEALSFQDQLSYWDGRFATVGLEDRNLPLIAEQRILKPRDAAGAEQIGAAFRRTDALPAATRDVLLSDGDTESFRRTYPFSPAFMQTLVHVSSALQRERTALKLMQQILVERREELTLGDLVPLGDLFDAIADGNDQPFTEKLKYEFEQARTLYQRTLRPLLLGQRGLTEEQASGPAEIDPALVAAFRTDDRLVKTLLLAALAPDVPALRGMTARRLAALNHGTIRSLIPGQEVAEVTRRLRGWASRVAELKVGTEDDPSVRLQLVGVNLGAILDRVTHVDNPAARRLLVRDVLLRELGVRDDGALELEHPVIWRGSRRTVELVYGNVRDPADLRDEIFEPAQDGRWRLVLDYPFDAATHSAAEDRYRVDKLRERAASRCVAWLPAFVTGDVLAKIANLVRIEYLLTGNRLDEAAGHLGADDRQRARDLLGNQGDSLRSELKFILRQAYGLARPNENDVLDWSDHLVSRDPGVRPKLDVGRPFADALTQLVDQLYTATYPDHPDFDRQRKGTVVQTGELRTVLDVVRRAADQEGRVETEKSERAPLQRIAHPLKLGEVGDGPFVLFRHWEGELERRAAQEGLADADIPVRRVRSWIADLGLETRVANLVIATYAELTQRAWMRAGRVIEPPATVDGVGDDLLLRRQELPREPEWSAAVERAGILFGYTSPSRVVSPRAVARFGRVTEQIATLRTPAAELVAVLDAYRERLGLAPDAARIITAEAASALVEQLHRCPDPTALVRALASATVDVPLVVLSKSLISASVVADALRQADWQVLDQLPGLDRPEAEPIRQTLRNKAGADENAAVLRDALAEARRRTLELIIKRDPPKPAAPPPPPTGVRTVRGRRDEVLAELRRELPAGAQVEITYRIVTAGDGRR